MDVSLLDEDETVAGTTEPADNETSTMEPLSFMTAAHNLPENSSHARMKLLQTFFKGISTQEKDRRRRTTKYFS